MDLEDNSIFEGLPTLNMSAGDMSNDDSDDMGLGLLDMDLDL